MKKNKIQKSNLKEIYAKIYSLDNENNIIETIEGKITGGSININGTSSSRRTCSLSIVSEQIELHTYYWSLKTRFKLIIGIKNYNDLEINWYNFGYFIISSFSSSESQNSFMISIQGQDKLSLLDGSLGGTITALTVDFGTVDIEQEDGRIINKKLPLKEIISSAVHTYAKEPFYNIVINDLDDYGVELMEYHNQDLMYVIINENTDEPANISLNPDQGPYYDVVTNERYTLGTIPIYNPIVNGLIDEEEKYTKVKSDLQSNIIYSIAKIEYGMTCGYRTCDLVYAGDLILNAGETITNMLDKIVSMLGNFEYFYDENGRFVFQHKKAYVANNWWNSIKNTINNNNDSEENYVANNQTINFNDNNIYTSSDIYKFNNNELITAIQNSPNLSELKNDYSVWGTRKGISGTDLPIHYRYSINKKPDWYKSFDEKIYSYNDSYEKYIVNKINEKYDIIKNDIQYKLNNFNREPNPEGLSNDWWEILSWARFYEMIMGEFPKGPMKKFAGEGQGLGVDMSEILPVIFKKPSEAENPSRYTVDGWDYFYEGIINIFDVIYPIYETEDKITPFIGFTRHGVVCDHDYQWFLDRRQLNSKAANFHGYGTSYIYKPIATMNLLEDIEEKRKKEIEEVLKNIIKVDWREILYIMANDYNKYHLRDDFNLILFKNNPWASINGITGYEQYYEDMIGFWRQLYCPIEEREDKYSIVYLTKERFDKNKNEIDEKYIIYYYKKPIYHQCEIGEPFHSTYQYYNEDKKPITKLTVFSYLKNPTLYYYISDYEWMECNRESIFDSNIDYYLKNIDNNFKGDSPWNINILKNPETLNFWIDFLNIDSSIGKYSVNVIGNRSKSINDNTVKSIYFRETPLIIFTNENTNDYSYVQIELTEETFLKNQYYIYINGIYQLANEWDKEQIYYKKIINYKDGYTYIYLPNYLENLFTISSQGKSAKDVIDEYLYTYAYCAEQINISSIPIYDLNINTRILIQNQEDDINGEYIVNSISLSLGHSGLMSISASKAVDNIF